jgi:translocon-associated protein subunit gamma
MAPKTGGKISREEELLLEGFNKNVSTKSSALFYGNAFIVSVIPVWLYWRVHSIDVTAYAILFAIGTLVSTWLLAFAYKNTKHVLKHKVAVKREGAVTKEIMKKLADDKKISKKEKDERILWKKNEVIDIDVKCCRNLHAYHTDLNPALFFSRMRSKIQSQIRIYLE